MLRSILLGFALLLPAQADATCNAPEIAAGMAGNGAPTREWIDAIRDRVDAQTLAQIQTSHRLFTRQEDEWMSLVQSEAASICKSFRVVDEAFRDVAPPRRVRLLLGNQAGDDAFTARGNMIVLDLAVFAKAYGPSSGQGALVRRILSHEYAHLLLVPHLRSLGWSEERSSGDPYLRAIRTLYNEGIANLQSVQDPKWVNADGSLTPFARSTVATLEPVMLERLQALEARPPAENAAKLLKNISQGPFARKWGAVPIALWLQADTRGSPTKLGDWIEGGPQNILALAVRNAGPDHRARFQNLLIAVSRHRANRGPAK